MKTEKFLGKDDNFEEIIRLRDLPENKLLKEFISCLWSDRNDTISKGLDYIEYYKRNNKKSRG